MKRKANDSKVTEVLYPHLYTKEYEKLSAIKMRKAPPVEWSI